MTNSEFFSKYPESKDLFDRVLSEFEEKMQKAHRPANETIISDAELIQLLGVCKRTTNTWRSKQMIVFIKVGSLIYYRYSEVLAFMEKHEIKKVTLRDSHQTKHHGQKKL
ncbi:helix-turn-helix domain-containing protein [Lacibacter sediminis]|uniref:Helix-turn-helix domain-containing protein n=1 Tax=Lacibacter sediminis TaxID=2760713 RepID=A0A7G5XFM9_9BACT|nr:helix-turn-helix domain-containing protein [Lacibacter sediminis]QNA44282.1 helix-turn-helix domain-containing protein [Lacibacter sediminis]